ncbi:hypothetical protein QWM81_13885 [Streptomyces ficellus]|uniref:Uncharacterized protein n=1 Tax=Streptomyces ficellus TaxID=1977088 RepID=A0ABT7Z6R6_9ACTN|nr:hypothetical protein [Streptomyces ficellus]MDN3295126.1 hypothetical protein [Streptomyces ficellus]
MAPRRLRAVLDAGPVREPLQPADRDAVDGLRAAYEELVQEPTTSL